MCRVRSNVEIVEAFFRIAHKYNEQRVPHPLYSLKNGLDSPNLPLLLRATKPFLPPSMEARLFQLHNMCNDNESSSSPYPFLQV